MNTTYIENETSATTTGHKLTAQDAELVIETMRDTLYRVDTAGHLIYASPSAELLTGRSMSELIGMDISELYMHPEKREEFLRRLSEDNGFLDNYEVELRHKLGHGIWVLINVRYFQHKDGSIGGIEGIIRDITPRKQIEQALDYEREKAQVTLKSIADGVITTDLHGRIEYMNPMASAITGWNHATAKGLNIQDVYQPRAEADSVQIFNPVKECLRNGTSIVDASIRLIVQADGHVFAVRDSASPIRNRNGDTIGVVLVIHDVTHIREMARKLAYQASHDAQTALLNRAAFENRIATALNKSQLQGVTHVLCYMDLDQFKVINDTCGHIAGDAMLLQIANIMQSFVREGDTIARLGGDEFGLLLESCSLERGIAIAETVREAVANYRFVWKEKMFEIGVSIGIVTLNNNSGDVADVLSKADSACFVAKDKGRNRLHIYREEERGLSHQHREMHWVHEIQQAFQENYFCLYIQEIRALNSVDLVGDCHSEILIRLDNGEDLVPPMAFIPAAERYNLMQKIDRWVIQKSLEKLADLHARHELAGIYSINISGASIADRSFSDFLLGALDEYTVLSKHLCFEVTETAAILNMSNAIKLINGVTERNCQFALDDFGCGLSSFYYLKNLPVQYLKIDGNFVQDIHNDPVGYSMVEAINNVGHVMGLKTIAEFAENEQVLEKLKEIGVDYAQGYVIDRPKPWLYP